MTLLAAAKAPHIDWAGFSPLLALMGGALLVLVVGLFRRAGIREQVVQGLAVGVLLAALGLTVWQWGERKSIISGALAVDDLALLLTALFIVAGIATVLLAWRAPGPRESGHGEHHALLLSSIAGMSLLVGAQNTVTLFLGLELLSISLYVLCATQLGLERSLESGLKYLIIGSVGSATLLYGLALLYGATGATDFAAIAHRLASGTNAMSLTGIGLVVAGLAFKGSVAPFHQWTPDVYEGAPTPITAFMAVATKAAAFGVLLRFFDVALIDASIDWGPALAVLATITIVVGNVGALPQTSIKRMLAWSGVAQAGYLLAGVVVATRLGLQATVFYLGVYLLMNVAAFAVVIARERVSERGDDLASLENLGQASPWLAWPMTIAMLSLAGFPATAGFIGKFYLIDASVSGDYTWLGVVIVVGSMLSLVYYLRVIAVMWMGRVEVDLPTIPPRRAKPVAGWSPEADARAQPEMLAVAVLFAAASILFGLWPNPLFDAARDMGSSLSGLF
jgi:NADH-quinone oxidoreductase subunit N